MKKYVLCLLLIIATHQATFSQNASELFKHLSTMPNVEKTKIDGLAIKLGELLNESADIPLVKGMEEMEIISFEKCTSDMKSKVVQSLKKLNDTKGYETLLTANEKTSSVRIVAKKDKDVIKEMLFFAINNDEPVIIKFTGNIKESDMGKIIDKYNK